MSWANRVGHQEIARRFERVVTMDKLASTYFFVGPDGVGKRYFAVALAEALLCSRRPDDLLKPCGECPSCTQVHAGNHPDIIFVERPIDKNVLPIELFIGDREHRSEVGLCRDIRLKPRAGSRKIAIIDDADYLNQESANALLKTLEEPPPHALIILIGTSTHRQLPTILSRCQIVQFDPFSPSELAAILRGAKDFETNLPFEVLADASFGSVSVARLLADPAVYEFRNLLLGQLASGDPGNSNFAEALAKFSEGAGKEGAAKRERLYFVADQAIEFYRRVLGRFVGQTVNGDELLLKAVDEAVEQWKQSLTGLGRAIDRLVDFQSHIEMNANAANAIDPLLMDLRRLAKGQKLIAVEL